MKTFSTEPRPEPRAARPCALCGRDSFRPVWDCGAFSFVACRRCGLLQQNPQPLGEAVLARYDASYLAYEEERQFAFRDLELLALGDLGFEAAAAPLAAKAVAEGRAPRFLDVGCATGALLDAMRGRGWEALGVEACAPAAARGRERFGLDIRACRLEDAGLPPASFEVVHSSHLIEHLNEPRSYLAEARRLLAPGGILVVTTPNADGFQARLLGAAWRSAIHDHLYLFTRRGLEAMLAEEGFVVESSATWGGWAVGLRPAFAKPFLDRAAKRLGLGDVMALLARVPEDARR